MKKLTPAKEHLIGLVIVFVAVVGILTAQQTIKTIEKEEQAKLQSAYREWQDASKTTEILRLRFNNVALETIANMGLPPKDYDITIDSNGQFIVIKRQVPNTKKEQ